VSGSDVSRHQLEADHRIAEAQEDLYQIRMDEFYSLQNRGVGEGLSEPIRYGVWVLVEPFHQVERFCPDLVMIDSQGRTTQHARQTDLFEREARESRAMTRGSEVVEGFWVGNDCDVPGGADDGAGARMSFDLCVRASECCEMPSSGMLSTTSRKLYEMDKRKKELEESGHAWVPSPATIALRNLLSPSTSPGPLPDTGTKRLASPNPQEVTRQRRPRRSNTDEDYVSIDCAGSCRTITGQMRNLNHMTERVVDLVYFLRKLVEGRDKTGRKRRVLVHCQDGYTESSIIVLAYIMSSLSISLPEAFLHLQLNAKRSFFLYPSDKPLLRKVDARLAADRRSKALKIISTTNTATPASVPSPTRWKSWTLNFGKSDADNTSASAPGGPGGAIPRKKTVDVARDMLKDEENGGSPAALDARVWFDDRRFDGFPSRILPYLYLGNL
jgi:dual specificity MAP kinase phosphatase